MLYEPFTTEMITPDELRETTRTALVWCELQRIDEQIERVQRDKAWLLVLFCTCLGLLIFVVMLGTTGALPW